ncbi:hypothetical protein ACLKA6_018695 [Drosophila palustris]
MSTDQKIDALIEQFEELSKIFPLEKEEKLLMLEEAISPETQIKYVTAMKKILAPVGIKKGLPRILSEAIVEKYNIHGVKQRKGLKSLPKFYRALLDCRVKCDTLWNVSAKIVAASRTLLRRIFSIMFSGSMGPIMLSAVRLCSFHFTTEKCVLCVVYICITVNATAAFRFARAEKVFAEIPMSGQQLC